MKHAIYRGSVLFPWSGSCFVYAYFNWSLINSTQGSPQSLGRAFAEPELKFVEEPYKKPMLKFFEITKGKSKAGELLGAFELIELDYSGFGEVCPSVLLPTC